jgi:hypothetical protein
VLSWGPKLGQNNKKNHPPKGGWSFKPKPTAYETKNLIFLLLITEQQPV